jgi:hypothetical protein
MSESQFDQIDQSDPAFIAALGKATGRPVESIHTGGGCMVTAIFRGTFEAESQQVWITREDRWLLGIYDFAKNEDDEGICVELNPRTPNDPDAVARFIADYIDRWRIWSGQPRLSDEWVEGVKQVPADHASWTDERKLALAQEEYDEAVSASGEGAYVVTETPDDPSLNACWVGWASNGVDALGRYTRTEGFGGYTRPTDVGDDGGVARYALDEEQSAFGACAVFTNTTIYAVPLDGLTKDDVADARQVVIHLNVAVPAGDGRPASEITQAVEDALDVGLDAHHVGDLTVSVVFGEEV